MNTEIIDYLNKNSVLKDKIDNYIEEDKFLIFENKLYIKTTKNDFFNNFKNNNFLAIKIREFSPAKEQTNILKDIEPLNPYDNSFVFYRLVKIDDKEAIIQLELLKIFKQNNEEQQNKITSINNKLTFFTLLAVINVVATVLMIWKLIF